MTDRREFLKCAALAAAALPAARLVAQSHPAHPPSNAAPSSAAPWRIDVHHHCLPPVQISTMGAATISAPAGAPLPDWSPARSLALMDANQIRSAIVSVSGGVLMPDMAATARLAHACNEYTAHMVADHPTRFGCFAALPLPDVKASLAEIAYSLDTLHADGIGLMTNYADKYLGDPAYAPVFDELHRRMAVVFVHPMTCNCSAGILPGVPATTIEFPHDTTRTIISLLLSGTLHRCRDIRFIFTHAGGTLPLLASRIVGMLASRPEVARNVPDGIMPTLRRLNFDTALSTSPGALYALRQLVKPNQILFGTDLPFAPEVAMHHTFDGLTKFFTDAAELRAVERDNALAFFPRFAAQPVKA